MEDRHIGRRATGLLAALLAACGPAGPPDPPPRIARFVPGETRPTPDALVECVECHANTVAAFLGHGMSSSLGADVDVPRFAVRHPDTAQVYEVAEDDAGASWFVGTRADGGQRQQRIVGRIGAGLFDVSLVGTETDVDGRATGRLNFLPVEWLTGHGPVLSPFEHVQPSQGLDMPVNRECLRCHTTTDPATLPGAATVAGAPDAAGTAGGARIWPDNQLGTDAMGRLQPLGCDACHGDTTRHADLMAERIPRETGDWGIARLGELPAAAQRDVCARCHLQGEGHLELAPCPPGGPQPDDFLVRRPVVVPAHPGPDFRFVGQTHRLSLSPCFRESPGMTCTTCHDPHRSSVLGDFDARCVQCHADGSCVRPPALTVEEAAGTPRRTEAGCVDCHVRRSQPFDLPGVRTADHFIRRLIEPPTEPPYRVWEAQGDELTVFDDGRFAEVFASDAGRLWVSGLVALVEYHAGRTDAAAALLDEFPEPGTVGALRPGAPSGLPALETDPAFHFVRGLVYELRGETSRARAAFGDALALDETHPQARLNRAALRRDAGDLQGAMADADHLVAAYPAAEKPWNLRAVAAAGAGDLPAAAAALAASTARWPSDADVWQQLALLLTHLGDTQSAGRALERARRLEPSRSGLPPEPAP